MDEDEEVARLRAALRETKRRLSAELTAFKGMVAERDLQVEEAGAQLVALQESNAELAALVTRLEEDIVKVGHHHHHHSWQWRLSVCMWQRLLFGQGSGSAWKEREGDSHSGLLIPFPLGGADVREGSEGNEGTMLEIVCGQRERFRKRAKEVEVENGGLLDALGKARGEVLQLRNDNVALIGKMKYLEQYNRQTVPVRRAGGAGADTVVFGGANSAAKAARYACFGVAEGGGGE